MRSSLTGSASDTDSALKSMVGSLTANGDSGRSGATSMSVSWTTVDADMSVPSSMATASSRAALTSASVSGRGARFPHGATPCRVSAGASHGVGPRTMVSGSTSACDERSRAAASATASHGVMARRRSVSGSGGSASASHGESQGGVVRGARRSTDQRGADDWTRSGASPVAPVRPAASSPTTTVGSSMSSSKSEAMWSGCACGGGAVVSSGRGLVSTGGSVVTGVAARRTMLLVVRRSPSPVGARVRRTAVPSATGAASSAAAGWPSLAATSIPS